MSTYVLVHGGGHGGWCYQRVSRLLRSKGHDVYCPTLTGLGDRVHLLQPGVDLDLHITDIVNVLAYENLYDVILAGHSYGGMVITGVADRASERIRQLVYLDAALPLDGESLADVAPDTMAEAKRHGRVVDGIELVSFPEDLLRNMGVTDPEDLAWMRERLTPQPWKTFAQPLRLANPERVKSISRAIVNCTQTLRAGIQRSQDRLFDADQVWEIDTGHDLMITEPKAVADILHSLA